MQRFVTSKAPLLCERTITFDKVMILILLIGDADVDVFFVLLSFQTIRGQK
ncbi:hypothetical protein SAMN06265379_10550 [Saccharicrinis carchari]|uniref:Uncharacterized protein n=1 Tax=Saccharicrinis carchari TaxID=1168039 RepID=A0A521DCA8_SACCC|nr:hypothetical protein SAMN06265379_10550 [Saccharicrinis carchari]